MYTMKKLKPSTAIAHLLSNWVSPSYIMLVGPPAVGKSTFLSKFLKEIHEKFYIASTDDLVEREAARLRLTYSEAFNKCNQKSLKREMEDGIEKAILTRTNVIHDQTNMGRKSRAGKLKSVPESYNRICLNFTVDDRVLQQRLDERAKLTGKVIPPSVMKNMFDSYNAPLKDEGFDLIIEVDNT